MPRIKKGVPWIDQRSGVYYAAWYDDAERRTKRFSLRTRDAGEAQGRFAAWLAEEGPRIAGKPLVALTVNTALDFYVAEHVETKVRDKVRLKSEVAHLRAFFGDTLVSDLDIPASRRYAQARLGGALRGLKRNGEPHSCKPSTVRKELATLLAAIRHNVAWKRLTLADVPTLERPSPPQSRGLWLTREEWARLRAAAVAWKAEGTETGRRAHAYLEIAYHTAARREAIETLKWFQVDLVRGRINFKRVGEAETKKRRVVVPIDPAIMPLLAELKAAATTEDVFGPTMNARVSVDAICKRAGLEMLPANDTRPAGRMSPHILRHTRATHLLQEGRPPWAVANLLGDNLQTVMRVYGHHCPDYLAGLFDEKTGASIGT